MFSVLHAVLHCTAWRACASMLCGPAGRTHWPLESVGLTIRRSPRNAGPPVPSTRLDWPRRPARGQRSPVLATASANTSAAHVARGLPRVRRPGRPTLKWPNHFENIIDQEWERSDPIASKARSHLLGAAKSGRERGGVTSPIPHQNTSRTQSNYCENCLLQGVDATCLARCAPIL